MVKRLLFVGAGAVGSYLAAFLARAGHDVTVIDPWPEQVEAIRAQGMAVSGPHDPFEARFTALHVHEAQRLGADFDIAVVAMKAYDTAWATHLALPHLAAAGYVVAAQNCWTDPIVAAIAGQERAVGSGHVEHRGGPLEARSGGAGGGARPRARPRRLPRG